MSKSHSHQRMWRWSTWLAASAAAALAAPVALAGPDVLYTDIGGVAHYGPVGGIHAYALGTYTCNIGNANLRWGNTWGGSPTMAMNAYRLENGRLMQIGMGWVKKACCAAAGSGCPNVQCNGVGGSWLGAGCRDVYSAGYNGSFSNLCNRSGVNAYTGAHSLTLCNTSGDAIFKRLQIRETDMDPIAHPTALYFLEGVYVASDDNPATDRAAASNNASYKRVTITAGSYTMTEVGAMQMGSPAILAWRAHGNGWNNPDPRVIDSVIDVPNEGRFHVAAKVTDLGGGNYLYDYAIFNLNSDVSGGSLSVPVPSGATVTNVGFHDVDYHSGELYDNTDWSIAVGSNSVNWSSPQTYAQNPNSNALRWGTMYNFWFQANRPAANRSATLGLFKPHTPSAVQFTVPAPRALADLNGDGCVNQSDLGILLADWGCNRGPGNCPGDVDGDGDTDQGDLGILLAEYQTQCP